MKLSDEKNKNNRKMTTKEKESKILNEYKEKV